MWFELFIHPLHYACLQDAAQFLDFGVCRAAFCLSLARFHGNHLKHFWHFSSVLKPSTLFPCHKHNTFFQNTDFLLLKLLFLFCLYYQPMSSVFLVSLYQYERSCPKSILFMES